MGRVSAANLSPTASAKERVARAHRSPRPREPGLGLSSHPGRAAQARPPLLSPDRAKGAAPPRRAPGAAPQPALLARVRPPARRQDRGLRLLHGLFRGRNKPSYADLGIMPS